MLPVKLKLDEIDFSGTGLSDEAWQLKPPGVEEERIPSIAPTAENGKPMAPMGTEREWNPDVELKLDSRPP